MKVAPMRAFLLATLVGTGVAFSPKIVSHGATVAQPARSSVVSRMSLFDDPVGWFKRTIEVASDNREAEAFHILLPITSREKEAPAALLKLEAVKKQCLEAKTPEKSLEVFSAAASKMSSCPSSQKGGFLGRFKRGAMVPTFDDAVFAQDTAPGTPVGPVLTMFGAHLIWVKSISNA